MNDKRDNIDLIVSASELTSVFDKKSSLSTLLQDITEMVADHMEADVCSIYLYDEDNQELVLRATVGLSPSSIGRVRLKPGEGITGIALKELRPVREARATRNPAFKFFKDINEEKFEAFLAVPIKKGLSRIGVITLQHKQPDYFNRRDTAALKAIASQLAASIENSQLLMGIKEKRTESDDCTNISIKGAGVGRGTVTGEAYFFNTRRDNSPIAYDELTEDGLDGCPDGDEPLEDCIAVEVEVEVFDRALELSMQQLEDLQRNTDESLSDVAGMIFTAHFLMLRDDNFTGEMRKLILSGHKPDDAVRKISSLYEDIFEKSDLPGIKEKVQDVKDLEHRLLANLYGESFETADYSRNIIIAEDIFPSELVKMWLQKARGLVLYGSGVTAHISILARSLGLPMFMSDNRKLLSLPANSTLLLDADSGILYVNPSDEIRGSYITAVSSEPLEEQDIPEKAVTADGTELKVQANINIIHDVETALKARADGIGLYRSEFPFIVRNEFPSEEEQYRIYRKILKNIGDSECVFRTLDIGGDKMPGYANLKAEANPFLGFRGIRFSLGYPEVFQDQVRAMLRAGFGHQLKIMFPMISSLDEFFLARSLVDENIEALKLEGAEINDSPVIGAMVEIPAAVEIIGEISKAADFMSIGTNDLIMYTLGVDRTNERVRDMYKPWHPAILRSLKKIAVQAEADGTELSVCGEAAGDPGMLRYMLGIGIRKFSIDPLGIPDMKRFASVCSISDCEAFAEEALKAQTVDQAEAIFSG